jgi:hypothetical protein
MSDHHKLHTNADDILFFTLLKVQEDQGKDKESVNYLHQPHSTHLYIHYTGTFKHKLASDE